MKRFLMGIALLALLPGLAYARAGTSRRLRLRRRVRRPRPMPPTTWGGGLRGLPCGCAKNFANNPHSKLALTAWRTGRDLRELPWAGRSACGIRRRPNEDPADDEGVGEGGGRDLPGCHAGAHPNFERSPHAEAG